MENILCKKTFMHPLGLFFFSEILLSRTKRAILNEHYCSILPALEACRKYNKMNSFIVIVYHWFGRPSCSKWCQKLFFFSIFRVKPQSFYDFLIGKWLWSSKRGQLKIKIHASFIVVICCVVFWLLNYFLSIDKFFHCFKLVTRLWFNRNWKEILDVLYRYIEN